MRRLKVRGVREARDFPDHDDGGACEPGPSDIAKYGVIGMTTAEVEQLTEDFIAAAVRQSRLV